MLEPADKVCGACQVAGRNIGEEVTTEYEYMAAKLVCKETVRPKYAHACACAAAAISIAPLPPRLVPQSKLGLNESDWPYLLNAAGRLASAPLRICDTREPDTFPTMLHAAHPHFDHALCDWPLSAQEKAEAHRLTHNSPITLWRPWAPHLKDLGNI